MYFKEKKCKGIKNFFVFNCVDYVNNFELLFFILFGYIKGVFIGVEKEKVGFLV